jgi:restriction system protein
MPIPDYQSAMLPLLEIAADGKEHPIREAIQNLAVHFGLSEPEQKELLPSGASTIFGSRVGWARTYLKKANLIDNVRRGCFQITERGRIVLSQKPKKIDVIFLRQYPEFVEFWNPKKTTSEKALEIGAEDSAQTPEDSIAAGYLLLRKQVESDLLAQVKICPPEFFERLVVRLLIAIGYGGSLADAGKAIGKSGDGGIDGVIKEDKLGLDLLYIQAKRWDSNTVGRPEIQGFVGALYGKKAKRGIFLTTSSFSKSALDYAEGLDSRVVLINGIQLAELMFEYGLGVSTVNNYVVKRVDFEFFNEDDGSS